MIPDVLRFWGAAPSSNAAFIWISIVFLLAYLVGSIPSGILITKSFGLGKLTNIGSGNTGATNVLRTGNKKAAILTLLMDAGKGIIVVILTEKYLGITASHFAALGAFCGHIFSIFLLFKGGKGVATFLGILLALNLYLGIIICSLWLIIAWLSKYSSLASLISSFFTIIFLIYLKDMSFMWIILFMVLSIWFRHRENIVRLIRRNEAKIKLK